MDLVLRNGRVLRDGQTADGVDVGIDDGRIAAIEHRLQGSGRALDLGGRLISASLVETHLHLDKSCILDRCKAQTGSLDEAIREVAALKATFTPDDVYLRARRTLERSIAHGV